VQAYLFLSYYCLFDDISLTRTFHKIYKSKTATTTAMENPTWVNKILELKKEAEEAKKKKHEEKNDN
jgi:hypothetical protein